VLSGTLDPGVSNPAQADESEQPTTQAKALFPRQIKRKKMIPMMLGFNELLGGSPVHAMHAVVKCHCQFQDVWYYGKQ